MLTSLVHILAKPAQLVLVYNIAYSDSNVVYSTTLLEHCLQQAHSAVTRCVALDMPAAVLGRQVAHKCSYGGTVAI